MKYKALFAALLCSAAGAQAGEKVLYQPAPAWVKAAPAIDPTKLKADSPAMVMMDAQQRLEGGQTWAYVDAAQRADSTEALSGIGTLQLPWQPAHGDLIMHRVEILRGAERIDVLKDGASVSVLRREQALEQRMLDGVLTATMQIEGLRVGDIVRLTFSITSKDPTLKGYAQTIAPLVGEPVKIGFGRVRLLWPEGDKVQWRALTEGLAVQPVKAGGYQELSFALPLAKPADMPGDAPLRFQNVPFLEATTFPDWATLSQVMAPLYAPQGLIKAGSPLAAQVAKIKAASADPTRRAAAALQLVQDEVRYQLMGMNSGNYVPQGPAETWSLRYGDCKAKTLLLLALLHELGIEAEAATASLQMGDLVSKRLPSAAAFDHVLVRATIGGETLWLDGTGSGTRFADLQDTPKLGHVLPLRTAGAALMAVAARPPARAEYDARMEIDHSAGLTLPAPFTATMTVRGAAAAMLKNLAGQGSPEQQEQMVQGMIGMSGAEIEVVSHTIKYDDAEATARVEARGVAYSGWDREDERWGFDLDQTTSSLDFTADRARPAWRAIPVATGAPSHKNLTLRIKLPGGGEGFALDGSAALEETAGPLRVARKAALAGGWATAESRVVETGAEIGAADIAEARKRVVQLKAKQLRLLAPGTQAGRVAEVEAARKTKALQPLIAMFDARIAAKPKEAQRYIDRAWLHEQLFDLPKTVADLGRAIAIEPSAELYLDRASGHFALGDTKAAVADAEEALKLDGESNRGIVALASYKAEANDRPAALALLDERIAVAGKDSGAFSTLKAEIQGLGGDVDAALATMDEAVAKKPGDAVLLNNRCWLKGTLNVSLDTGLKDCTRAIELAGNPAGALDSRAMIYFRMKRTEEARADLEAALALSPDMAASLFLRGVMRKQAGDAVAGAADVKAAATLAPRILKKYERYGIRP